MKREEGIKSVSEGLFPQPKDRIIFALNTSDFVRAQCLVALLSSHVGYFKFGLELTNAMLASLLCPSDNAAVDNLMKIRSIFSEAKGRIFWDGRLTGIARTIGQTTRILSDLGVSMLSVQAGSRTRSINAAIENKGKSLLFAATSLSSVDSEDYRRIKNRVPEKQLLKLVEVTRQKGIDGIICSSHETAMIRELVPNLLIATGNVHPAWTSVRNRKNLITPGEAIAAGADALIIGGPISHPSASLGDPTRAAERIVEEIEEALAARQLLTAQETDRIRATG